MKEQETVKLRSWVRSSWSAEELGTPQAPSVITTMSEKRWRVQSGIGIGNRESR